MKAEYIDVERLRHFRCGADALTFFRIAAAPGLWWAVAEHWWQGAACIFVAAAASDFFDGPLARRALGGPASSGRMRDHAADALFVVVGLAALSLQEMIPPLLPLLIALAFLEYAGEPLLLAHISHHGLATHSGEKYGLSATGPRPSRLGRTNGLAYYVLLGTPLLRGACELAWPSAAAVRCAAWLLVFTTMLSVASRTRTLWYASRS